ALVQQIAETHAPDGTPPTPAEQEALRLELLRWMVPLEQPLVLPRRVEWLTDAQGLFVRVTLDFYNASGAVPEGSRLEFMPHELSPLAPNTEQVAVAPLPPYALRPVTYAARVDQDRLLAGVHPPLRMQFSHGTT